MKEANKSLFISYFKNVFDIMAFEIEHEMQITDSFNHSYM